MGGAARFAPPAFILLWSSAFVAARAGLPDVSPLYFLFLRFAIASSALLLLASVVKQNWSSLRGRWHHFAMAGMLINGVYLACSYIAMTRISAATMALMGSLHPIGVALLSGPLLGDRFRPAQWAGFAVGIAGVVLVVGIKAGDFAAREGLLWAGFGVAAFVAGTLHYSRFCRGGDLVPANAVQLTSAGILAGLAALVFEDAHAAWTLSAVATLLYLTFAISLGGMALLLFMLRTGQAGKVAANFYLTSGTTAALGWLFLGEALGWLQIAGFALATAGVWLVNRAPTDSASRKSN